MKRNLIFVACALLLQATGVLSAAFPGPPAPASHNVNWVKSKSGSWAANREGKSFWYRLDRNARIWWSPDGHEWAEVTDGMWADKQDRWLKIGEGKLWWTADAGKNFEEVPEWKWQGPRGEWYKFDAKWTLWVAL
ncbi:hypothetical protein [Chitinophaga rhizosphaerae]|uniref:hypothetical protein n=1 Tax=Chitinophaga rhizosphaerae TaxID=1864947 RepID=UPI000F80397F|nr:hypothetical protein [Chitinophaga rhizosphaerae]